MGQFLGFVDKKKNKTLEEKKISLALFYAKYSPLFSCDAQQKK